MPTASVVGSASCSRARLSSSVSGSGGVFRPAPPPSPPPSAAPPAAPSPPSPSPSPPSCIGQVEVSDCYHQLVLRTNNGLCADGGEGSVSDVCAWGHDWPDCPSTYEVERHEARYRDLRKRYKDNSCQKVRGVLLRLRTASFMHPMISMIGGPHTNA